MALAMRARVANVNRAFMSVRQPVEPLQRDSVTVRPVWGGQHYAAVSPSDRSEPLGEWAQMLPVQGEIAPGWEVVSPLWVTLEQEEDGSYVASDDLFAVYGIGDTRVDAVRDYILSLTEYYELVSLRAEEDVPTQELLYYLRRHICKVGE